MTRSVYHERTSFLSALALVLALAACGVESAEDHAGSHSDPVLNPPSDTPAVSEIALTDESLYALDGTWTDQNGSSVQLASLKGRPVVISMVFTRCAWACPMIVRDMKEIGKRLPEEAQDRVQYVLVTLDPERDTPDVLSSFARSHRLDASQWTLLQGRGTDIRLLAALLGIRYRKESNGQFSHSNVITLLNEEGEIVHLQEGLGSDPTNTVEKLNSLIASRS